MNPPPASFATIAVHSPAPAADTAPAALAAGLAVQYFPHAQLPVAPAQRLQELFQLRPQWVREELVPFIAPIASGKLASVDNLLLKHVRSIRARWSRSHRAVLLHGSLDAARGADECQLCQARVKY